MSQSRHASSALLRAHITPFVVALCAVLTACSAEPQNAPDVQLDTVDVQTVDVSRNDIVVTTRPDTGTEPGADTGADSTVEPACSTLGCSCVRDQDCDSEACIRTGDSRTICSELCVTECSLEGYDCVTLSDGGDGLNLCVPDADNTCQPCRRDADCGSVAALCMALLDGNFCAPPCAAERTCPTGFMCERNAVGTESVDVCVPESGVCEPCFDLDNDGYGIGDACLGTDCNEDDPGSYAGALELCDDRDNDCDLNIDEDFDFDAGLDTCGACGAVCDVANGTPVCDGGACGIAQCDPLRADCNNNPADGCEVDLSDPLLCGSCIPVTGVVDEACGVCQTGVWTCAEGGGTVCEGDLGEAARNACGGCTPLDGAPADACGTCGTGSLICSGTEALVCAGDQGVAARNACGGCSALEGAPATACGTCNSGVWQCADDQESVTCEGDAGAPALNPCGGCASLAAAPETPCGPCDSGRFACAGTDAVACEDDGGEDARNACGGCAILPTGVGELGSTCGGCDDGLVVCSGANATLCSGDQRTDTDEDGIPNACDTCRAGDDALDHDADGVPDACDCDAQACAPDALCEDDPAGASCGCPAGFEGDGTSCTEIDECDRGFDNCSANATCTNTVGAFTCACNSGFTGSGQECADINECDGPHDCHAYAICSNQPGSFDCVCLPGYGGDGRTCSDLNECALETDNCSDNAICSNRIGGFRCDCEPGYEGDGTTCVEIDECERGTDRCSPQATCANTPGDYDCSCIPGYEGDGFDCADVNECETAPCHPDATCTNTPGTFECACNPDYSGDGFTCTYDDVDYSGTYPATPELLYQCGSFPLISYEAAAFDFIDVGRDLTVHGISVVENTSRDVSLTGTIDFDGNFSATGALSAGSCVQTLTLTGAFTDADSWSGMLNITYSPPECLAGDRCLDHAESVAAHR